jgi:DNA-binding IclR family transcriptional regulator
MIELISNAYTRLIRVGARSILIQRGPHTCSDLARAMGIDPAKHKGTLHAILVDLERAGALAATRSDATGKRDLWFHVPVAIRKRDRLAAAILG